MKFGLAALYSWRPHVEQAEFLATLMRQQGHEVVFLTCDSDLPACYTREVRSAFPSAIECSVCRLSGIRSFESDGVSSIGSMGSKGSGDHSLALSLASSSASTLGRFEAFEDFAGPEHLAIAERLAPAVDKTFNSTMEWISKEKLDGLLVFNGRIDITRAVFEAGLRSNIPVVSYERSLFGDGVLLLPYETCLGLRSTKKLVESWREKPLTAEQSNQAGVIARTRLTGAVSTEWRSYHQPGNGSVWPLGGPRRVLILPGSWNEIHDAPERSPEWISPLHGFTTVVDELGLRRSEVLVRYHPGWADKIGKQGGERISQVYDAWASENGFSVIPASNQTNTQSLIRECDLVVVWDSSAAIEAGLLGKRVIHLAPAMYSGAGFALDGTNRLSLKRSLKSVTDSFSSGQNKEKTSVRFALRFIFTMAHRVPQFTDIAIATSSSRQKYFSGGDGERLIKILLTGNLTAYDQRFADSIEAESRIVDAIMEGGEFPDLVRDEEGPPALVLNRRGFYRIFNALKAKLPPADSWIR